MHSNSDSLLRVALRANAAFSSISGVIFLLLSTQIAAYLGDVQPLDVLSTGISLVGFALLLLVLASRRPPARPLVLGVIALDAGWVLLTLVFCLLGIFAPQGAVAALVVAAIVAGFAVLQWRGLQRLSQ